MLLRIVRWIGARFLRLFTYPLSLLMFLYNTARSVNAERGKGHALFLRYMTLQVYWTGVHALPVATLSAVALGAVIFGNAIAILEPLGLMGLVADKVPGLLIREVAPIIVTLIIIGRSGTAVTAELGNMVVNHEIKTLHLLGVDVRYMIVFPRLVGITLGVVALMVYFNMCAIWGGMFVVKLTGIAPINFTMNLVFENITALDILVAMAKSLFIGGAIALIHCYHGLAVRKSSTEVPQQATRAVVNSIVYSFVINGLIFVFTF